MPVARVRKYEVIHRRIRQDQSREKPRPRPLLPQRSTESPDRQHRRRQKRRTAEVHRGKATGRPGHAVPEIEEALQADDRKARGMLANPVKRQPFALGGIPEFAHALELLQFQLVEIGLEIGHQHAVGTGAVAQAELQSKIIAYEDEAPERFIVANQPRRKNQKKCRRRQQHARQRRQPSAISLPPDPEAAEGQKGQHGGIGQRPYSVQRSEQYPAAPSRPLRQFERDQKYAGENQRRESRIPDPVDAPIPDIRTQRPGIRRPDGNPLAEGPVRDPEDGDGGQRGKHAVDREQHPRGGKRVDAENLEHPADQERIKRRLPGRGAGVAFVGAAEAVSQSDGAADAAHLEAKAEVVLARPHSILMEYSDRRQLQRKRERQEPEKESGERRPGGFHHRAIVYQAVRGQRPGTRGQRSGTREAYSQPLPSNL